VLSGSRFGCLLGLFALAGSDYLGVDSMNTQGARSRGFEEAMRIVPMLDDLEFFVTDVRCSDCVADLEEASAIVAKEAPMVGVVMLSAGPKRLIVHARVPPERANSTANAVRLVAEALSKLPHHLVDGATDLAATGVVDANGYTDRDPFADKDDARTAVADYMQEEGLFGDESDYDEN
jgi:hypothetical protein